MRIYLTGFMGAGKTRVGERLARRLGVPFVDLDREIEALAGLPVREIFARHGETEFRRLERQALEATLHHADCVVATGGGTLTFPENAALVATNGLSIWLNPAFATIVGRLGGSSRPDRPLFRDEAQAFALYQERLPAYRQADLRVDVAPEEQSEEVAARIALLLAQRVGCVS